MDAPIKNITIAVVVEDFSKIVGERFKRDFFINKSQNKSINNSNCRCFGSCKKHPKQYHQLPQKAASNLEMREQKSRKLF